MQVFHSKVMVGLLVSGLLALATNVARADDPTGGTAYYQLKTTDYFKCLGLEHQSTNNGTQMEEQACLPSTGAQTQAWKWNPNDCINFANGGGYYTAYCTIRSPNNKCLGTYAGSANQGTYAVLWDCLGTAHTDQYWATSIGADGTMHISNYKARLANHGYGLGFVAETRENGCTLDCIHDQVGLETSSYAMTATPVNP